MKRDELRIGQRIIYGNSKLPGWYILAFAPDKRYVFIKKIDSGEMDYGNTKKVTVNRLRIK